MEQTALKNIEIRDLRNLTDAEIDSLYPSLQELYKTLSRRGNELKADESTMIKRFKELRQNDHAIVRLAFDDSKLIGGGIVTLKQLLFAELGAAFDDIVVSKDYQGMGIGKRLMTSLLDETRERGAKWAELENHPARQNGAFYEKLGFKKTGSDPYEIDFSSE